MTRQSGGALLVGALLCLALVPAQAGAIVNGTAPNRAWPAQALVSITGTPPRSCGGTLVSGRWVLTAGHCVGDRNDPALARLPASSFTVSLGETDLTQFTAAERFSVDQVVRDPQFAARNGTANHDVALLRLSTQTPATPAFEPMRLVTAGETALWSPGAVATVIGWGATVFRGPPSQQLLQAGVPIIGDDGCAAAYPLTDPNPFDMLTMVCAGDGVQDTCSGDSGGPLMVPRVDTFALAGVTSYGFQCGDASRPGVYARVGAQSMNDWVRTFVPTAAISTRPASPDPGANVVLTASADRGGQETATPQYRWDLDDDGVYDDDTGTTAVVRGIGAGSTVVRVQETYPDGDRALAREVVTTAGSPLPQPPPPPPPPPRPAAPASSARTDPVATTAHSSGAAPDLPALARLLPGPRRVRVSSLFDGRLTIGVRCSVACSLSARFTLDGRTAHRIGLARFIGSTLIGTGSQRLRKPGKVTLAIRLRARAVRALHRTHDGATRVRVTARSGKRIQRLERTITLRG